MMRLFIALTSVLIARTTIVVATVDYCSVANKAIDQLQAFQMCMKQSSQLSCHQNPNCVWITHDDHGKEIIQEFGCLLRDGVDSAYQHYCDRKTQDECAIFSAYCEFMKVPVVDDVYVGKLIQETSSNWGCFLRDEVDQKFSYYCERNNQNICEAHGQFCVYFPKEEAKRDHNKTVTTWSCQPKSGYERFASYCLLNAQNQQGCQAFSVFCDW
eukprot:Awhi_evm1s7166